MRRLDRSVASEPVCLPAYRHGRDNWSNVKGCDKEEIRGCLEQMQGRRCAYCEGDLDTLGQHIEHFWRKSVHPARTFDWENLYWSCNQTDSCGHFKDHGAGAYDVAHLVDPCRDDPDRFFIFRADGTIDIRSGLTEAERHRASETLRVFGLNDKWGRLRNMRKRAVSGYLQDVQDAIEAGFGPDDLVEYFRDALQRSASLPFSTAIRHVLTERP
jgi:uncharacterized protein (TIGR02646 family)